MVATTSTVRKHQGPPLLLLSGLYLVLFIGGLSFVSSFTTLDRWPAPGSPAEIITHYFQTHHEQVASCLFLQFSATICLGIFSAAVVSRLLFLGIKATGPWIALLGGLLTVVDGFAATFAGWAMIHPSVAQNGPVLLGLYYLAYGLGGVGFAVPFGLLLAGIAVPAGLSKLIPRWLMWCGLALALAGELSSLHLLVWQLLPLIPLTRFPGFLWLIALSFMLPTAPRDKGLESE